VRPAGGDDVGPGIDTGASPLDHEGGRLVGFHIAFVCMDAGDHEVGLAASMADRIQVAFEVTLVGRRPNFWTLATHEVHSAAEIGSEDQFILRIFHWFEHFDLEHMPVNLVERQRLVHPT
jgi:hypothetical protein